MTLRHASDGYPHGVVSFNPPPDLSPEASASLTYWSRVGSYDAGKECKKARMDRYENQNALRLLLPEGRRAEAGAVDLRTQVFDLPPLDPYMAQLT
jgi:hypothetical protein